MPFSHSTEPQHQYGVLVLCLLAPLQLYVQINIQYKRGGGDKWYGGDKLEEEGSKGKNETDEKNFFWFEPSRKEVGSKDIKARCPHQAFLLDLLLPVSLLCAPSPLSLTSHGPCYFCC